MTSTDPWTETSDALFAGLTHALGNRVATVSACAGMLDPADPDGQLAAALRAEVRRLEAMLGEFRLLALDPRGPAVPLHLPDYLPHVVALHGHHPALRDVPCEVAAEGEIPPVLASEGTLTRALLVLLTDARRAALASAGRGEAVAAVRLVAAGDARQVAVRIGPVGRNGDGPADRATSPAARWAQGALAERHGDVRDAGPGAFEVRLPSLAEGRRHEAGRAGRRAR